MTFKIHYNGRYEDSLVISGNSIEEIKPQVYAETERRGWETKHCWSERIEDEIGRAHV